MQSLSTYEHLSAESFSLATARGLESYCAAVEILWILSLLTSALQDGTNLKVKERKSLYRC